MSFEQFLTTYGYLGIAVGALLEGETMLVLGGLAAYHGLLQAGGVMAAGFAGGIAGDQIYFYLGRRHGVRMLARRPRWQAVAARITERLDRRRDLFIFGFRFLYGLRVVSPLLIGLTDVSAIRYTLINVVGGVVWAGSVTLLVILLGHGVEAMIANFQLFQLVLFAAMGVLAFVWWWLRRFRARLAEPLLPPPGSAGELRATAATLTAADGSAR